MMQVWVKILKADLKNSEKEACLPFLEGEEEILSGKVLTSSPQQVTKSWTACFLTDFLGAYDSHFFSPQNTWPHSVV